jgi:hypothetical protein
VSVVEGHRRTLRSLGRREAGDLGSVLEAVNADRELRRVLLEAQRALPVVVALVVVVLRVLARAWSVAPRLDARPGQVKGLAGRAALLFTPELVRKRRDEGREVQDQGDPCEVFHVVSTAQGQTMICPTGGFARVAESPFERKGCNS